MGDTLRLSAAGWLMLAGAAFFAVAVGYVWRRRGDALAVSLLVMLLAGLEWSVAYALELSAGDVAHQQFWGDLKYVGICLLTPAWLAFVFHYLGRTRWPTRLVAALLAVEPLTVLVLLANDATHDLVRYYTPEGGAVAEAGPLFWAHLIYTDVLLWVGTAVFVIASARLSRLYRRQGAIVFVSVLLPWAANLLFNLRVGPFGQVDLSPFAFTVTAAVLVFGVFRFGLLDQRPMARSQIFETIPDPVLVLDPYGRVIDANPAAARLVGLPLPAAVGQPAVRLLPALGGRAGARAGRHRAPARPGRDEERVPAGGLPRPAHPARLGPWHRADPGAQPPGLAQRRRRRPARPAHRQRPQARPDPRRHARPGPAHQRGGGAQARADRPRRVRGHRRRPDPGGPARRPPGVRGPGPGPDRGRLGQGRADRREPAGQRLPSHPAGHPDLGPGRPARPRGAAHRGRRRAWRAGRAARAHLPAVPPRAERRQPRAGVRRRSGAGGAVRRPARRPGMGGAARRRRRLLPGAAARQPRGGPAGRPHEHPHGVAEPTVTARPSIQAASTRERTSSGSPDQTQRVAALPGASDPTRSSTPMTRAGVRVTARSAVAGSSPSFTARAAWTCSNWMGTTGWSVMMPSSTPAAASRPGLASERLRSSTLDREVSSGPISTGTPRSAMRSASSAASVPWSITSR